MRCLRSMPRATVPGLGILLALALAMPAVANGAANNNKRANTLLNQRIPEVRFDNVALKDCIDFLHDAYDANIHINWKILEAAGISQSTTVNMRLRDVTLRKALNLMLSEAGAGVALTFYVDEGVIEITTTEQADKQVVTRIYPVDDLLMTIPDFDTPPNMDLSSTSTGGSSGRTGGSSSGGSGGGGGNAGGLFGTGSPSAEKIKTKTERAEDLLTLIRLLIRPEIWKENGGPASLAYYNGNLIVTAPRSVQEALGGSMD